jgi:hypothetical protein
METPPFVNSAEGGSKRCDSIARAFEERTIDAEQVD